jgi:hypothetical protein
MKKLIITAILAVFAITCVVAMNTDATIVTAAKVETLGVSWDDAALACGRELWSEHILSADPSTATYVDADGKVNKLASTYTVAWVEDTEPRACCIELPRALWGIDSAKVVVIRAPVGSLPTEVKRAGKERLSKAADIRRQMDEVPVEGGRALGHAILDAVAVTFAIVAVTLVILFVSEL